MPQLSLVLFDDSRAQAWEPFTLTRPAGELIFGALTFRRRAELVLGGRVVRHLSADHLQGYQEEEAPEVSGFADAPADGDRLFLLSRVVPDWSHRERPVGGRGGPVGLDGRVVGWFAAAGEPSPPPEFFADPEGWGSRGQPVAELRGRVVENVWELISGTPDQLEVDIAALHEAAPPRLPAGVHHWGSQALVVHPTARLEPGCAIDTSEGAVWIDRGAVVRAFTRLCGPAYVGPHSHLLGGSVECVSLGPVCRVRGEMSTSVCLGYTNKQHDGHMGHAYLGRWVNLGAETTNSDLKNNYGSIRVWTPAGEVDSGEIKLGSLVGDHVKTGIGLLLNTGTVVGAGSNLYGAEMPPKFVPPFSWGTGEDLVEYRLDKFLEVAERAMARRDVELTASMRAQLERAWERARAQGGTRGSTGG